VAPETNDLLGNIALFGHNGNFLTQAGFIHGHAVQEFPHPIRQPSLILLHIPGDTRFDFTQISVDQRNAALQIFTQRRSLFLAHHRQGLQCLIQNDRQPLPDRIDIVFGQFHGHKNILETGQHIQGNLIREAELLLQPGQQVVIILNQRQVHLEGPRLFRSRLIFPPNGHIDPAADELFVDLLFDLQFKRGKIRRHPQRKLQITVVERFDFYNVFSTAEETLRPAVPGHASNHVFNSPCIGLHPPPNRRPRFSNTAGIFPVPCSTNRSFDARHNRDRSREAAGTSRLKKSASGPHKSHPSNKAGGNSPCRSPVSNATAKDSPDRY